MRFTGRHAQDLAEIKALAEAHLERARLVEERVDRLEAACEHRRMTGANRAEAVDGSLLAFVHIPKTAGGTVKNMLGNAYPRTAVADTGNVFISEDRTASRLARPPGGWERWHQRGGKVTIGHVPYGLYRRHLPANTRYVTFLREPVDRVLSLYHRHLRLTGTPIDRRRQARGLVLVASLEEAFALHLPQISNVATRFLCGVPSLSGDLPATALDDAKNNLREFAFVGIQERFEESIVLLQRMLGLSRVAYLNRHVSATRPAAEDPSTDERALIVEHNRLDAELYTFAVALFDDAVAAANDGFRADVEALGALVAEEAEQATREAKEWLDRELPPGMSRPRAELYAAAAAAGVPTTAIKLAVPLLPLKLDLDENGVPMLIRTGA
jgi:hypothetical protein